MSLALEKKKKIVEDIVLLFKKSKSTIFTDYRGLTVKQMNELRKELADFKIEYKVLKNTLLRKATENLELEENLKDYFVGPTAVAFSQEDVVAPAKVLYNFAKSNDALAIKGGFVEGKVLQKEEVENLAKLPSYNDLVAMFLSVLQAPIRNFALVLKALADKKGKAEDV